MKKIIMEYAGSSKDVDTDAFGRYIIPEEVNGKRWMNIAFYEEGENAGSTPQFCMLEYHFDLETWAIAEVGCDYWPDYPEVEVTDQQLNEMLEQGHGAEIVFDVEDA